MNIFGNKFRYIRFEKSGRSGVVWYGYVWERFGQSLDVLKIRLREV